MPTVILNVYCVGGSWSAIATVDGAVSVIGFEPPDEEGNLIGQPNAQTGVTDVTFEYPCPDAVVPDTYGTVRSRCGCNFAIFGIGKTAVCTGAKGAGGCDDLARFRVTLDCCSPIAGWEGPGYYCARAAGTEDNADAVLLHESDKCNPNIEIVSGPYPTLADAEAACGPPPAPQANCSITGDKLSLATAATGTLDLENPDSNPLVATEVHRYVLEAEPGTQYKITWAMSHVNAANVAVFALNAAGVVIEQVYSSAFGGGELDFSGTDLSGACGNFAMSVDEDDEPVNKLTPEGTAYICVALQGIAAFSTPVQYRMFVEEGTCS